MKIASPEFGHIENIPLKFTCEGIDVNPTLEISNVPEGTQALALIVDDPDAPAGTWVHWVVYDMPVLSRIEEDSVPGRQAVNDFKTTAYGGPCPPSGTHRYFFKLYALDTKLDLPDGSSKADVEKAMEGHVLERAELIGLYKKGVAQ